MMCNPTLQAGLPTLKGNHIYTQVGCRCDVLLLHLSPHLSLAMDLVAEEPNT
jgi:hypothetical protein